MDFFYFYLFLSLFYLRFVKSTYKNKKEIIFVSLKRSDYEEVFCIFGRRSVV